MPEFLFRNVQTGALVTARGEPPVDTRALLPAGTWEVALLSPWATGALTVAPRTLHVFLIAGQSNATSRAPFDGGADWPANAYQMERFDPLEPTDDEQPAANRVAAGAARLIPATRPLHHHFRTTPGGMDWALPFAIAYLQRHPGVDLAFVPAARGATGFHHGRWRAGGDLYTDAVTRVNVLMAGRPDAVFGGVLWHQGERDAVQGLSAAAYRADLDSLIDRFRADIAAAGPATPVVLGELLPDFVAGDGAYQAIQEVIAGTPGRRGHTAVASSAGTTGPDGIHFDSASLRLMGQRYAAALEAAVAGVQPGWSLSGTTILAAPLPSAPGVSGQTVTQGA